MENGRIVFSRRSPFFALSAGESYELLDHNERQALNTEAVVVLQRVVEKHQVEVREEDPLVLIDFPKEHFAESIDLSTGIIIR